MSVVDEPWARVPHPVELPAKPQVAWLMELDDERFAELVRHHLLPPGPQRRDRWIALWALLVGYDPLAERAFDVLEELMVVTEQALASGALEEAGAKRARRFLTACRGAWHRLEVGEG